MAVVFHQNMLVLLRLLGAPPAWAASAVESSITPLISFPWIIILTLSVSFILLFRNTATYFTRFAAGLRFAGLYPLASRRKSSETSKIFLRKTSTLGRDSRRSVGLIASSSLQSILTRKNSVIDLLHKVASASNAASSSHEVMKYCLKLVCEFIHWPIGHIYLPDPRTAELISSGIWYLEDASRHEIFRMMRSEVHLAHGYGLSGRAWAKRQPEWIEDVAEEKDCPRSKIAKQVRVHAAFAAPILAGDEVVAVMEFFSSEPMGPDSLLLDMVGQIGLQLGRVIERERADKALKESEDQFRALSSVATEGVVIHVNGVITELNEAAGRMLGGKANEFIGTRVVDILLPEGREAVSEFMKRGIKSRWQGGLQGKDGQIRYVEANAKTVVYRGQSARVALLRDISEEKQKKEALQESEQRFRNLSDAAFDGVIVSEGGTVVDVNERFLKLFGYDNKDEVIGMRSTDFVTPQGKVVVEEKVSSRSETPYEVVGIRRDGTLIDLEVCGRDVRYQGKRARVAALRDITERKAAESVLKASETRFRLLFDNNPQPMWVYDRITERFLEVNESATRIYGYDRAEFLALKLMDIQYPPTETLATADKLGRPSPGSCDSRAERTHRLKNGNFIQVEATFHPMVFEGRDAMLMVNQNITERKEAERALKDSEERFRLLSESAFEAVIIHKDYSVVEANQAFVKMFGYEDLAELKQVAVLDLVQPSYREMVRNKVDTGDSGRYEMEMVTKDGRSLVVEVRGRAIPYAGGIARVATLNDITERKRTEEMLRLRADELARSNRELEQFAYVASHDLQEPLRMISSYIDLLSRRYRGVLDGDADEFIGFAVDGAKRMKQQIDDLLAYSRVNRMGTAFIPLQCSDVIESVLANLRLAIEESRAEITVGALPSLMGDAVQLAQVFQNLLSNAIKFRKPSNVCISIDSEDNDKEWIISVKDNGIGIDMEYSERIFLIFQRLHTVSEYPGTGIGLAICKKIIERHGGRIWVESKNGEGSTFRFTIPKPVSNRAKTINYA